MPRSFALLNLLMLCGAACDDTPPVVEPPPAPAPTEVPVVEVPRAPVVPEAPPPPPPPTEPKTPEPVLNADGSVLFTPMPPVCLAGEPTLLYPPCGGGARKDELVIDPGKSVGLIVRGKPISASTLCKYGYAADIQGRYVAWWPSQAFEDLSEAREKIGAILAEGCEGGWSDGLVQLSRDGLPDSVRLTDHRFRTRSGVGVGTGMGAARQKHPGGAMTDNEMEGGIIYEKDGVSLHAEGDDARIRELWVWL